MQSRAERCCSRQCLQIPTCDGVVSELALRASALLPTAVTCDLSCHNPTHAFRLQEELLRSIASLNARLAIAEEGGTLRAAATRDDELKEALRAMERRLEMREFRWAAAAAAALPRVMTLPSCSRSPFRPKFGVAGVSGEERVHQ